MRLLRLLMPALMLPSLAWAVDPPVIAPGECLYLTGAPPGFPAAATEVTGSGTYVYDECRIDVQAAVGRDAPNEIQMWAMSAGAGSGAGCVARGYAEHAFVMSAPDAAWVSVTASGSARGFLHSATSALYVSQMTLTMEIVRESPEGLVVLAAAPAWHYPSFGLNRRTFLDEEWSGSVTALVPDAATLRARLVASVAVGSAVIALDLGAPGSGYGISYESLLACVTPAGGAPPSDALDGMERDLYDKRCPPYLWLPQARGGRLEEAMAHVLARIEAADASDDPHANVSLARDRMTRASADYGRGEYQRTCRSVSDALRAITTP